jgi:hypothetical protein
MSKLEATVAISTTEAEYMALLQAVKESIWIQRFLKELDRDVKNSDVIMEHNQRKDLEFWSRRWDWNPWTCSRSGSDEIGLAHVH